MTNAGSPLLFFLFGICLSTTASVVAGQRRSLEEDDEIADQLRPTCNDFSPYENENDNYLLGDWSVMNLTPTEKAKLNKVCPSPTSNARGTYTSHLVACTFRFHHIEQDNDRTDPLSLSAACAKSNLVTVTTTTTTSSAAAPAPVEQYVTMWPDECVGDYNRCYSVVQDEQILLKHFCKYYHKGKDLPAGTTHVSVDCTADKQLKKDQLSDADLATYASSTSIYGDPYLDQERKRIHEMFEFVFAMVAICLCACFACLFCCYRCGFRPYLAALKQNRGKRSLTLHKQRMDEELEGLAGVTEKDEVCFGMGDDTESSSADMDDGIEVTGTVINKSIRTIT